MRMAVTGGAGFVGSHVVEHFHSEGHEVLVVDNLSRGLRSHIPNGVSFSQSDIFGRKSFDDIVAFRPNAVVHLAAQMSVVNSIEKPSLDAQVNILGTLNMLEAAQRSNACSFVFASSGGALYGDAKEVPSNESTEILPQSPYGVSKACAEQYLSLYDRREDGDLRCVSLRLANVFGPRQSDAGEGGVISIFADRMANKNQPPTLFGDGLQTRDFVFVDDVVSAIDRAIFSRAHGPINIGTGCETSLMSLTSLMRDITGYRGPVETRPSRSGEVVRSCLSIGRAAAELDWQPKISLYEGLRKTIDSVREVEGDRTLAA